jgi:hypothetical protein
MVATTFHPFPKLSAELRCRVWYFAVLNDVLESRGRIIEFYNHDPSGNAVSVAISKRYPSIFHVSHEARHEAIREFPGEVITVEVNQKDVRFSLRSRKITSKSIKFDMFMNFKMDTVFLSKRFSKTRGKLVGFPFIKHSLTQLATVMPKEAMAKVEKLLVTCKASSATHDNSEIFEENILEVFQGGRLAQVILFLEGWNFPSNSFKRHLVRDVEQSANDTGVDVIDIKLSEVKGAPRSPGLSAVSSISTVCGRQRRSRRTKTSWN